MIGIAARLGSRLQPPADLDPRDAGQHPVEHDDIGLVLLEQQKRLVAVLGLGDAEAFGLEVVGQDLPLGGLVLDHQDPGLIRGHRQFPFPSIS